MTNLQEDMTNQVEEWKASLMLLDEEGNGRIGRNMSVDIHLSFTGDPMLVLRIDDVEGLEKSLGMGLLGLIVNIPPQFKRVQGNDIDFIS